MLDLTDARGVKVLEQIFKDVIDQAKENMELPYDWDYYLDDKDEYLDSIEVVSMDEFNRICAEHSDMSIKLSSIEYKHNKQVEKLQHDLDEKHKYYKSIIKIKTKKIQRLNQEVKNLKEENKQLKDKADCGFDDTEKGALQSKVESLHYENMGLRSEIKDLRETIKRWESMDR